MAYFIVPVDYVPELRRALESADLVRTKEDRLPARSVVEVRRSGGQKVSTWSPQKYRDRSIPATHREDMDCASVAGSAFIKLFDWSRMPVSAAH